MGTLHIERFGGECVMADYDSELRKHLPVIVHARGRVLVTGLGLGCVVRGLLTKPEIEHIDVIEKSNDVIKLVAASFDDPRVTIHCGDALRIVFPRGTKWDYAWHDIWIEDDFVATQHLHGKLIVRYHQRVRWQSAWAFPREVKRLFRINEAAA